jgi:UDP:flavonoid glycosyltransferase YjiC (YdhE family)
MKALFIPFAPSLAHVSRCLAVAEVWRARGHTALFAVGAERNELVRAAGFETRLLPEVSGQVFRTTGLEWMTAQYFSDNLSAEREILAEVAPDVVVSGFRFTTALAARLAGCPSASILHGSALCFAYLHPRETGRLLVQDAAAARGSTHPRALLVQQLFPFMFQFFMQRIVWRWAALLKAHGCPPVRSPYALLLGDEVLAADLPELLPSQLPPRTHVVGPLAWSGWEAPTPWLDELDARPLIYVTMGSTIEASAILQKILEALRDGAYNVVVSAGPSTLPGDAGWPACIRILPTVPGASVARRSAVIVHLSGHGTLMQALSAGAPSLLLPANPDQFLVAQQAQRLSIGYSLWRPGRLPVDAGWQRAITPGEIRRAIEHVMNDQSYVRACQALQRKLNESRGATLAAEKLESIVQG